MIYENLDSGWGREQRAQMRREIEHNRLRARLASRPRKGGRLEEADERKSLIIRGASAMLALLR